MTRGKLELIAYTANGGSKNIATTLTSAGIHDIIHSALANVDNITGYEISINMEEDESVKYLRTDAHGVTYISEKRAFRSPVEGYVVANYITSRYNV
jgi:HD superfamily phosphodiesterase